MLNIIPKDWPGRDQEQQRGSTKYAVWHHSACMNQDQDVDEINQEHINIGDIEIAYNRVIKGAGITVQGRQDDSVSAAAHGVNQISIDVVVEGDFEASESSEVPTEAQIQAIKDNMVDINAKYPGIIHIGHYQVAGISRRPRRCDRLPGQYIDCYAAGDYRGDWRV